MLHLLVKTKIDFVEAFFKSTYTFRNDEVYFPHGFDTTLFQAESVKNRRNQGLFVMKALFLMIGIWSNPRLPAPWSAPARVRGCTL